MMENLKQLRSYIEEEIMSAGLNTTHDYDGIESDDDILIYTKALINFYKNKKSITSNQVIDFDNKKIHIKGLTDRNTNLFNEFIENVQADVDNNLFKNNSIHLESRQLEAKQGMKNLNLLIIPESKNIKVHLVIIEEK